MKSKFNSFLTFLMLITLGITLNISAQNKFVGAASCGICHKKAEDGQQLKIWQESGHANAFKTLQSEESNKIAKEKGLSTKASESPECLSCHVTGHGVDAKLFTAKFNIEDGVQCEACHGAGSEYKTKKVMQDKAVAISKGLTDFSAEGSIEKKCLTCHNEKSPTFKGFKFDEMWAKIKHEIPKKG